MNARAQRRGRDGVRGAEVPPDSGCAAEESRECDLMTDEHEGQEGETTTTLTALSDLTPELSRAAKRRRLERFVRAPSLAKR